MSIRFFKMVLYAFLLSPMGLWGVLGVSETFAETAWKLDKEPISEVIYLDSNTPPFWAYHQSNIVRYKEKVYATVMETLEPGFSSVKKQWHLFEGEGHAWRKIYSSDPDQRLNQPPLLLLDEKAGILHVFVCPEKVFTHLQFDLNGEMTLPEQETPDPGFTEFWPWLGGSINTDGDILICLIHGNDANQYFMFRDAASGSWTKGVAFSYDDYPDSPTGYDRHTYPFVVLNGREAHIFSTQDIEDPVKIAEGAGYTYSYHKLDYYYSPNVLNAGFQTVPVANIEHTRGWLHNDDMMLDRSGRVHLLYYIQGTEHDGSTFSPQIHAFGPPGGPLEHVEIGDAGRFRDGRLWESPEGRLYVLLPRWEELYMAPLAEDGTLAADPISLKLEPGQWGTLFAGQRIFVGTSRASTGDALVLEGLYRHPLSSDRITLYHFQISQQEVVYQTGDFNGDDAVDFTDFLLFAGHYGLKQADDGFDSRFDLNADGKIDFTDFLTFVQNYQ